MPPDADALLIRVSTVLDDVTLANALKQAGDAIGVAALAAVSDYPTPSRKPLPLIYTRTVMAARPYRAADGSWRVPGATYRSKFKTMKQQRFVMAMIAAATGERATGRRKTKRKTISSDVTRSGLKRTFPYKRTGMLGRSLTYQVSALGRAKLVIVRIGSNIKYAKYVIGDTQAPYHKGVWTPLRHDIENARNAIERAGVETLRAALNAALSRGR